MKIDRGEQVALHDQVAAEIRKAIAEGEAAPGERLPLARDLAAVLSVNKNTELRALHILREEGLLEFRRGRGITVAEHHNEAPWSNALGSYSSSHVARGTGPKKLSG